MVISDPDLLRPTPAGLFCPRGEFFIDPHRPVATAVVTHAHADHVVSGCRNYIGTRPGEQILRGRIGPRADLETLEYEETRRINDVEISFHPAGHILGSGQIRIAYQGEVWVYSGDYHLDSDATCAPYEVVPCDTFVTESTFGHPGFHWPDPADVFTEIEDWWRENQSLGRTSLLFAYALGKSQRILSGIDASIGPIHVHASIEVFNSAYRESRVPLPVTVSSHDLEYSLMNGSVLPLIIAPPTLIGSPWTRRFGEVTTAFASGWMQVPNSAARRGVNRGFVLSDHADHLGLLRAIQGTGASRVFTMHGYSHRLAAELNGFGLAARPLIPDALDPQEWEFP